ncbi:hypothetical protein HQ560_22220 [bacterium]|nr:hypothetical protein [bacterium]
MKCSALSTLLLVCAVVCGVAVADLAPTRGTFTGVYDRDRWGVGWFGSFVVHPSLHEKLAEYEGRRIRLVVVEARQPMNPGPAIVTRIGAITPLDVPTRDVAPLAVTLETRPKEPAAAPFQLLCRVANRGKAPLRVRGEDVAVWIRMPRDVEGAELPSFLDKAYTRRQLAVGRETIQMYQCLVKTSDRRYTNLSHGSTVLVPPGGSFPFVVLFRKGLPVGPYEVGGEARATSADRKLTFPAAAARRPLDVAPVGKKAAVPAAGLRVLRKSVTAIADGYKATLVLAGPEGEAWRIAGCDTAKGPAFAGHILALAKDGSEISLKVAETYHATGYDLWRLHDIPAEGVQIETTFRKESRFVPGGVARLALEILTDRGVETFAFGAPFTDVHVSAMPAFGKPAHGVNIRVRPARSAFARGVPLVFHLQAVSVSGEAICWRMPRSGLGPNIGIVIDGATVRLPGKKTERVDGWPGKWLCTSPREWTVALPDTVKLDAGEHTLRYAITSTGGTYRNADHQPIPILRGRIASNEVRFVVE